MAPPVKERDVDESELEALEGAATERDIDDDELSSLEAAAAAHEQGNAPVTVEPAPATSSAPPVAASVPDEPLVASEEEPPAPEEPSALQRFAKWAEGKARSAAAGATAYPTWNFADEAAGMLGARDDMLRAMKAGEGIPVPDYDSAYMARRNDYRAKENALREENPGAYHVTGGVAALLAPSPVPRVGAGTSFSPLSAAVRSGAIYGGLSGLGSSEAELANPEYSETGDAAIDTATGAVTGGLLGAGIQQIGQRLPGWFASARDWLAPWAERRAVKAVTGQNQKAIMSMLDKETLQQTGRDLLDEGIVTAGRSVEEMRNAAANLQRQAGVDVGQNLRELNAAVPAGRELYPDEMARRAYADVVAPMERMTAGDANVAARLRDELRALMDRGARQVQMPDGRTAITFDQPMGLPEANSFKSELDKFIKWDSTEPPPVQDALRQLRGNINSQIEGKINQVVEAVPDALGAADRFREAKRIFGSMANVAQPGLKQQARETANRLASASDYGSGGVAALLASLASGGDLSTTAMVGAAGLGANKLLRQRGPQAFADWANRASRAGGPLDVVANLAPEVVEAATEAMTNPAATSAGAAVANAVRPDFSNGPRARAQLADNQALYKAVVQNAGAFGRYGNRLATAASRGPEAFALQDWMLAQTSPEYAELRRKALLEAQGSNPDSR